MCCVCPRFYVLTSRLSAAYSKLAFLYVVVMRLLGDHAVISKEGYRAALGVQNHETNVS